MGLALVEVMAHLALVALVSSRPMPCRLEDTGSQDDISQYTLCLQQLYGAKIGKPHNRHSELRKISHAGLLDESAAAREVDLPADDKNFLRRMNDDELHTFPGCDGLTEEDCLEMLGLLNNLLNDVNVFEAMMDEGGRHRETRSLFNRDAYLPWRLMKRTGSVDPSKTILDRYMSWREENGYGSASGRWGRDLSRVNQLAKTHDESAHNDDVIHIRRRRAATLSPLELYTLMEEYRMWRAQHGYGQHVGRYGR